MTSFLPVFRHKNTSSQCEDRGLALIAVVGRGMKSASGTAGKLFTALANKGINIKMIDQGSSELNIIIGVENRDFETAIKAIYSTFITK